MKPSRIVHASACVLFAIACDASAPREASTTDAVTALAHENPVLAEDCPDPGVLREDGADGAVYTMVCTTNGPSDVFRLRRSRDLAHWETTDRFVFPGRYDESPGAPLRHPWASDNFWAPEIHVLGGASSARRYVVYYTARHRETGRLCIGTATAPRALGPYTESDAPIVCHEDFGVIDAHVFQDEDGAAYLYWKDDGNDPRPDVQAALHGRTRIHGQRLTADGLHLADDRGAPSDLRPTALIDHDLDWEGDLVEAPWVVARNGWYYLFYSAFSYCDARYAVGVARARSPLGPFVKHPSGDPILASGNGFDGPGHGSVVLGPDGDTFYFVYHAWDAGRTCHDREAARRVLVDRVDWGYPTVAGQLVHASWPRIGDGRPNQ